MLCLAEQHLYLRVLLLGLFHQCCELLYSEVIITIHISHLEQLLCLLHHLVLLSNFDTDTDSKHIQLLGHDSFHLSVIRDLLK